MPIKHTTIVQVLNEARDATVPPKEGFIRAWNAVPAYREYLENERAERDTFSFADITDKIDSGIRSMEVLAGEGLTLVFQYVRSTGRYIAHVCRRTLTGFDD